jgi:hypothetical protein
MQSSWNGLERGTTVNSSDEVQEWGGTDVEFKSLQLCLPIGYDCPRPGRFPGPVTFPQYNLVTTPAMAAPLNLTGRETRSSGARSESLTSLAARYCPDSFQPRAEKFSVATSWNSPDLMYSQCQYSPPQSRQTDILPYTWVGDGEILSVLANHDTDEYRQHRSRRVRMSSMILIGLMRVSVISNKRLFLPTAMTLSISAVTRFRT